MERISKPTEVVAWILERLFEDPSGWDHVASLSLLGGLTPQQALWRPAPQRRCIWELMLHMLVWREFVARRLAGAQPDSPESWPAAPDAAQTSPDELQRRWQADLDRLRATQRDLIRALKELSETAPHPSPHFEQLPHWAAAVSIQAHDSYHLGQIAMLRGMQGLPPVE